MRTRNKSRRPSSPRDHRRDYEAIRDKIKNVSEYKPEGKVVLYGKPGTGKTTLACTFPKPLLLIDVSEKGSDSVRDMKGVKVIRVKEWDELEMLYWYLVDNEDGYKTVVIDTMSYAQELAIKKVLEDKGKSVDSGEIGGWGTMTKQNWGAVSTKLKSFITDMRDLELNVVFIAHDRVFNEDENDDESAAIAPSVGPRLMPSVASVLNAAVGVIGNTYIRERFKNIKVEGKKTQQKRIVEYCLRIGPHSVFITKVRKPRTVETPESIVDPEYSDIIDLITGEGQ